MKILYLPFETYVREFDSLFALTIELSKVKKYDYIIVGNSFVLFLLAKLNLICPGVWQLKSAQSYLSSHLYKLTKKGFKFTIHNAESLCTFDTKDRYDPFVHPKESLMSINTVLTTNIKETEYLTDYINNNNIDTKILKLGNLRLSILKSQIKASFYDEQFQYIKKHAGSKYILYNSTAGIKYHYNCITDVSKIRESLLHLGIIDSHVDDLISWSDHSQITLFCFLDFLRIFRNSELFKKYKIIFRPHPSEDKEFFIKLLASFPNVIVDDNFSVIPWILYSSMVVGSTSTTLIESAFLRKPTFSLLPEYNNYLYNKLLENDSAKVSIIAKNSNDLFTHITSHLNQSENDDVLYKRALHIVGGDEEIFNNYIKFYTNIKVVDQLGFLNLFKSKTFMFTVNLTEILLKILLTFNYKPICYVFKKSKNIDKEFIFTKLKSLNYKTSIFKSILLIKLS